MWNKTLAVNIFFVLTISTIHAQPPLKKIARKSFGGKPRAAKVEAVPMRRSSESINFVKSASATSRVASPNIPNKSRKGKALGVSKNAKNKLKTRNHSLGSQKSAKRKGAITPKFNKGSNSSGAGKMHQRASTAKAAFKLGGMDATRTKQHLQGINLQKPVGFVNVKPKQKLTQFSLKPESPGSYATLKNTQPTRLGINPEGRKKVKLQTKKPTYALSSTAAPVKDYWTVKPKKQPKLSKPMSYHRRDVYQTKGGSQQLYFPHKSDLKADKKPPKKK